MELLIKNLFYGIVGAITKWLSVLAEMYVAAGLLAVFIFVSGWLKEKLHEDTYTIIKWVFFIIIFLVIISKSEYELRYEAERCRHFDDCLEERDFTK